MDMNLLLRTSLIGPPVRKFRPLVVEGAKLPEKGPYLLVLGPHSTELESLDIAAALPESDMRFYVKQSYMSQHTPFALVLRSSGQIPIDRTAPGAQRIAIERGADVLVDGKAIAIYPEGTRYTDGLLHPFGGGAVQTAWEAERKKKLRYIEEMGKLDARYRVRPYVGTDTNPGFSGPGDQFLSTIPLYPCGLLNFLKPERGATEERGPRTLRVGQPLFTGDFLPADSASMKETAVATQVRRAMTVALRTSVQELSGAELSSYKKEITER